jgi:uncharacterized lipoprotein
MLNWAAFCCLVGVVALAGCSREATRSSCQATDRYVTARSAPPIQVPDDLTPPNESDALRLPPVAATAAPAPADKCLESPPEFAAGSRGARNRVAAPEAAEPADESLDPERSIDN